MGVESIYNPIKTGKSIREIRESQGMSLATLARQMRISIGLLVRYELGEEPIPLKVSGEMAFIFHVNPSTYICYDQVVDVHEV